YKDARDTYQETLTKYAQYRVEMNNIDEITKNKIDEVNKHCHDAISNYKQELDQLKNVNNQMKENCNSEISNYKNEADKLKNENNQMKTIMTHTMHQLRQSCVSLDEEMKKNHTS